MGDVVSTTPGSGLKLMRFMAQSENRAAYAEWLKDPMTQAVFRMTEDSIRPVVKPDSMNADRYGGLVDGRYEVLRLMSGLDLVYTAVEASRQGMPEETFGVESTLRTMFGYSEEEAQMILRRSAEQKLREDS
jgi:hypothetical protein